MSSGGLINIVSNYTSDIFLTGDPQITFYKMSYRRYTNFSIDTVDLPFDNSISFDNETELIVNRFGDLIGKSCLHITIPSIEITKKDVEIDINDLPLIDNPIYKKNYDAIKNVYMDIMSNIYKIVYKGCQSVNVSYLSIRQDVKTYVNSYYVLNKTIKQILDEYNELLTVYKLNYRLSNLWYIITHINYDRLLDNDKIKNIILKESENGINHCRDVQKYFFELYQNFTKQKEQFYSNNIKSAWTEKLGHSMIDYIDIFIGGKRIDRHLGIWIDIWNDLVYKETQIDSYNNLIGNIDILTNFDTLKKPLYDIYVPMSFWFNKYNGLAFPLIAMQYNDIRINVKLRKFEEVFYIEKIYKCYVNNVSKNLTASMIDFIKKEGTNLNITDIEEVDVYLQNIWDTNNYSLTGNILADYIYLDNNERKRFAQSGHEYLIDTNQNSITENVNTNDFDIVFDQFKNQCKELVWVTTQDCLTNNKNGSTKCQWYNYTNDGKNPITTTQLNLNGHVRLQKQNSNYYNNYQPYIYHKRSIPKGINMYSFCLEPLQHQPSGACNFTVIDDVRMYLTIDNTYYRYINEYIYPYDLDINFNINITKPNELLEKIDYDFALFIINKYTNENVTYDMDTQTIKKMLLYSQITIKVYNMINEGNYSISLNDYRKIYLKTEATFYAFNSALNILRLIGGYGSLAYSGNV